MWNRAIKHSTLTRISAWELCQARQEAALLTPSGASFGLCLNACVLARCLRRGRQPVFRDGTQVLQTLSPEIVQAYTERYLQRFADTERQTAGVNPSFDEKRFQELKRG